MAKCAEPTMTPFRLDHPWRRAGWGALAVILVSSYSRAAYDSANFYTVPFVTHLCSLEGRTNLYPKPSLKFMQNCGY